MNRIVLLLALFAFALPSFGDGFLRPPKDYKGPLSEDAQEAIIVFTPGTEETSAKQDMILKIAVNGQTDDFAWIIPFPNPPKTAKESAKLFDELRNYVRFRTAPPMPKSNKTGGFFGSAKSAAPPVAKVEVISRELVGAYEVAVVRENEANSLNAWLKENGYQPIPTKGAKVVAEYRAKNYVFACVKVRDTKLATSKTRRAELHPLRFSFDTGGRDGVYFPMRLTGLQDEPFNVNLHIFHRYWLNDRVNGYGYLHRGLKMAHRDWDTARCQPSGGKSWSDPAGDSFLADAKHIVPSVTKLMQKRHPGRRFYLTTLKATRVLPADILEGRGDYWFFPFYTNPKMIPYDAQAGGPAHAIYK